MSNVIKSIDELKHNLSNGVLMSIDYGQKKIGIAISNNEQSMALPLKILQNDKKLFYNLNDLIIKHKIIAIIIGLPVNMDGSRSTSSKKFEIFAQKLAKSTNKIVFLHDERRTTKAANELLSLAGFNRKYRNEVDDKIAASLILDSVINQLNRL